MHSGIENRRQNERTNMERKVERYRIPEIMFEEIVDAMEKIKSAKFPEIDEITPKMVNYSGRTGILVI